MAARLEALWRRLSLLRRRRELDGELEEELRSHLQMEADRARAEGASEDEARRAARLRLGNPAGVRPWIRAAAEALASRFCNPDASTLYFKT